MSSNQFPLQLFRNIALCFSGGGYRAAGFSLGILSYLNHVKFNDTPLLENVKGLSTVSGGTITGVAFAKAIANGVGFNDFFDEMYNFLNDTDLLKEALDKLNKDDVWTNTRKKRTLINAFALSYRELVKDEKFGAFSTTNHSMEDIAFNATDCSYGLAFRFKNKPLFGNYRLEDDDLTYLSKDIKLADIIAASSCFPFGFEPIIMPDDFFDDHQSNHYTALKNNKLFLRGIGLMDGGIVDNQGIGSIRLADKSRAHNDKFDLIMVCDVSSYMMDPWEQSDILLSGTKSRLNLRYYRKIIESKIKSWWWVVVPLCLLSLTVIFSTNNRPLLQVSAGALAIISLISLIIKFSTSFAVSKLYRLWKKLKRSKLIPGPIMNILDEFEMVRLRLLRRMFEERLTSGFKIINEIFLKQIRRLNYNLFYTDESLRHRRSSLMIYELTKEQYEKGESDEKEEEKKHEEIPAPGDKIYEIAGVASKFGTTLWFTKEDKQNQMLQKLIACGQFTACYNLLKYCIDLTKDKADIEHSILKTISDELMSDWKHFIEEPNWLIDKYRTPQ